MFYNVSCYDLVGNIVSFMTMFSLYNTYCFIFLTSARSIVLFISFYFTARNCLEITNSNLVHGLNTHITYF